MKQRLGVAFGATVTLLLATAYARSGPIDPRVVDIAADQVALDRFQAARATLEALQARELERLQADLPVDGDPVLDALRASVDDDLHRDIAIDPVALDPTQNAVRVTNPGALLALQDLLDAADVARIFREGGP